MQYVPLLRRRWQFFLGSYVSLVEKLLSLGLRQTSSLQFARNGKIKKNNNKLFLAYGKFCGKCISALWYSSMEVHSMKPIFPSPALLTIPHRPKGGRWDSTNRRASSTCFWLVMSILMTWRRFVSAPKFVKRWAPSLLSSKQPAKTVKPMACRSITTWCPNPVSHPVTKTALALILVIFMELKMKGVIDYWTVRVIEKQANIQSSKPSSNIFMLW